MSSTRQHPPRKLVTQNGPPSPAKPKPAITLDEWEANTRLGEDESRSVVSLRQACERKPLPPKFQDLDGTSRPSTPVPRLRLLTTPAPGTPSMSRPGTPSITNPNINRPHHQNQHQRLHWEKEKPITTPEQFHDWFTKLERSVLQSQESHFHAHLENVSGYLEMCNRLLESVDCIENELESMLEGWRSVEEGGKSLKDDCERVLEEKADLEEMSEAISFRLEYFQELESATRMLNRPGESIVLTPDFLLMVERVDICLDFLRTHREYKEAELYILRYQQCLTRAMTLIQLYFINSLKHLTSDIQKRLLDKELSTTARSHLLYTKFRTLSTPLAPLIGELESRAETHESLLTECHVAYCNARRSVLVGKVMEDIRGLDSGRSELVTLTRSGCTYLKALCTDEFELYKLFFNTGEAQFYAFLENLCDYLYDDLRPRIFQEQRLQTLCDVVTVIQALMIPDVSNRPRPRRVLSGSGESLPVESESNSDEESDLEIEFNEDQRHRKSQPYALRHLHVGHLLQLILQDAQTRLVFRTESVLQSEVRYYTPRGDDLDYPGKLQAEKINGNGTLHENGSAPPSWEKQASTSWYPTLQKTLRIISQLHDTVKPAILSEIAQEAVLLCSQSLSSASSTLGAKTTPMNGTFFLIRHLLILKEVVSSLDFEMGEGERVGDGGSVADALSALVRSASSYTSGNLFSGLGKGESSHSLVDARLQVDKDLRQACESAIEQESRAASMPVHLFTEQCIATNKIASKSKGLPSLDFAKPERLLEVHDAFRETCRKEITEWIKQLRLYVQNDTTAQVLVQPMQSQVVEEYTRFRDIVRREYTSEVGEKVMSLIELWSFLKEISRFA